MNRPEKPFASMAVTHPEYAQLLAQCFHVANRWADLNAMIRLCQCLATLPRGEVLCGRDFEPWCTPAWDIMDDDQDAFIELRGLARRFLGHRDMEAEDVILF